MFDSVDLLWLLNRQVDCFFEFDYVCSDHITFVKVFFVYEALHGSPTLLEIGYLGIKTGQTQCLSLLMLCFFPVFVAAFVNFLDYLDHF